MRKLLASLSIAALLAGPALAQPGGQTLGTPITPALGGTGAANSGALNYTGPLTLPSQGVQGLYSAIVEAMGGCPGVGRAIANFQPGESPPNFNSTPATENAAVAVPVFLSCGMTINAIATYTDVAGAAGAVVRIGLYSDNGAYAPGSLIEDCGTATATGGFIANTVTCGSAIVITTPGLYWCVLVTQAQASTQPALAGNAGDSPGISFSPATSTNAIGQGAASWTQAGVTGALPSTWAGTTNTNGTPGTFAPRCELERSA